MKITCDDCDKMSTLNIQLNSHFKATHEKQRKWEKCNKTLTTNMKSPKFNQNPLNLINNLFILLFYVYVVPPTPIFHPFFHIYVTQTHNSIPVSLIFKTSSHLPK